MDCGEGFYKVTVVVGNKMKISHRVHAKSDYVAAMKVRRATGLMAEGQDSVLPVAEQRHNFLIVMENAPV